MSRGDPSRPTADASPTSAPDSACQPTELRFHRTGPAPCLAGRARCSIRDGAPVLHVSHDSDGDWQFLCGGNEHGDGQSDGGLLVCLECRVADDLTLNELSTLARTGLS